jgi:hypothetical protein
MDVGRPVLFYTPRCGCRRIVSQKGDIVGKGVNPHIDHMLFVERNGMPQLKEVRDTQRS